MCISCASRMQALLFGATHPRATLHALSWRLSASAVVILDDTSPVWRECDQQLLLLISRAPTQRDLGNIDSFRYLRQLTDRYNGGDCSLVHGEIRPDLRSQLDAASGRLMNVIENRRSMYAPDDVSVLLPWSHVQWSKLLELERTSQHECEHLRQRMMRAHREVDAKNKRIAELEAELLLLKRQRAADAKADAEAAVEVAAAKRQKTVGTEAATVAAS